MLTHVFLYGTALSLYFNIDNQSDATFMMFEINF